MDFVITLFIHNSTDSSLEPRIHVDVMWHKTSPELQIWIKTGHGSRAPCWRWFSCTILYHKVDCRKWAVIKSSKFLGLAGQSGETLAAHYKPHDRKHSAANTPTPRLQAVLSSQQVGNRSDSWWGPHCSQFSLPDDAPSQLCDGTHFQGMDGPLLPWGMYIIAQYLKNKLWMAAMFRPICVHCTSEHARGSTVWPIPLH